MSWLTLVGLAVVGVACGKGREPNPAPADGLDGLPGVISRQVVEGGPNPAALSFTIANLGNCPLAWTLAASTTDGKPWLGISPTSGTVAPNGPPATISVTIDVLTTPPLTPGGYTGSIVATGTCTTSGQPAARSPRYISVNLNVTATGAILDTGGALGQDLVTLQDKWSALSNRGAPAPGIGTAAFTGYELLQATNAGFGRYSVPGDAWRPGTSSISLPLFGKAVWSGTNLLVYNGGGTTASIHKYAPGTNQWTTDPVAGAVRLAGGYSAVWTGTQLVVWGTDGSLTAQGGAFNPTSGAFPFLPAYFSPDSADKVPPRVERSAVWTGSELIIFGGSSVATGEPRGDGERLLNPGGNGSTWRRLSPDNAPSPRSFHTAVWTGSKMIVWGGQGTGGTFLNDGKAYDPARDEWSDLAPSPLGARARHSAVWTGSQMIIWGGGATGSFDQGLADGAVYTPDSDSWVPMTTAQAPPGRLGHGAIWTGNAMLVFLGQTANASVGTLFLYR